MHATGTGLVYSNAEMYNGSDADLGPSNEYNIDLAPKVSHAPEEKFHCAGLHVSCHNRDYLGMPVETYLNH